MGRTVNDLVEQLVSVVAEEAEHCDRMLTLLRCQQRFLIEGDTAGIESNAREQESAIRRVGEMEKRRRTLLDRLADAPEFHGEAPDMERLITTLSDDYGRRLRKLRESLAQAMDRVTKVKEQNTLLIERSLSSISDTMRLLAVPSAGTAPTVGLPAQPASAVPVSVDRMG